MERSAVRTHSTDVMYTPIMNTDLQVDKYDIIAQFSHYGIVILAQIGILEIVKYLLRTSNVAVVPPLRATATDAPTFIVLSNFEEKNKRSRNEMRVPAGEA